jgi:hypothetical protein
VFSNRLLPVGSGSGLKRLAILIIDRISDGRFFRNRKPELRSISGESVATRVGKEGLSGFSSRCGRTPIAIPYSHLGQV